MPNYNSPKEALFAAGLIDKIGKGRISKANNDWLDNQIANGAFTVSGLKVSTAPVTKSDDAPVMKREKTNETGIVDIGEPYRNEAASEAFDDEGNSVGMRSVCNNCGSSLTYCFCPVPMVNSMNGAVPVSFKKRTKPLPVSPWS